MSRWTEPSDWARLTSIEGCPVCERGAPTSVIAELETSWVTMGEGAPPLPGSCAIFFRRHVLELHELSADEGAAYMRDIQRLSRVVHAATGAVKLNYEIHGNTIPHLHTHIFPRYRGDPFEDGPIDLRRVPAGGAGAAERHAEVRRRVIAALHVGTRDPSSS